mmetsp:Transcript_32100/g.44502  ORF Transcript_32100/g.44502 Transcript_32100/m.44502 type:complete len:330 (-) Transcript_32100:282-1271(-)|eukprot:CAMPEP_0196579224 /NCGR_PEP_ID=MMETSP1081-20130531/19375_1 /TAXON_ID=36882 /ORGANISM="Pyramimonas amylifera, Strain CCMP720" /LENGTH=329 /DNA_ID=CAMNT_0041898735 /DNA_START=166 /DNA_END=1155 /DNA_ORIENTATION=+
MKRNTKKNAFYVMFVLFVLMVIIAFVSITELSIPETKHIHTDANISSIQNQVKKYSDECNLVFDGFTSDGCKYVYIDVGANIGVQIRKLFQPELFPCDSNIKSKAPSVQDWCFPEVFEQLFGPLSKRNASGVCAFAFEANPVHTARLKQVESAYRERGQNVHIFTETAAGKENGYAKIYRDIDELKGSRNYIAGKHPPSLSASTARNWGQGFTNVTQIDLAEFVLQCIAPRIIPASVAHDPHPPVVMMKMDVEGSEYSILPRLLSSGALCALDSIFVEYHENFFHSGAIPKNLHQQLLNHSKSTSGCKVKINVGDDESYYRLESQPPLH